MGVTVQGAGARQLSRALGVRTADAAAHVHAWLSAQTRALARADWRGVVRMDGTAVAVLALAPMAESGRWWAWAMDAIGTRVIGSRGG